MSNLIFYFKTNPFALKFSPICIGDPAIGIPINFMRSVCADKDIIQKRNIERIAAIFFIFFIIVVC